uniref:FCP1 homology domain-containing protein n=1 Tax=Davidia involucrata TaxID=16924 RepID=A0A5B6ZQL3_DAVIN
MPSLKMKTKSTVDCLREKNGLRVCQKSGIISKNSCSRVWISQQAAEFETNIQNYQDVSLCNKVHAQETGGDEAIDHHELLDGENLQFQKQLSPLIDSVTVGRMESATATCPSNLETIFSPILESIEVHSEPNVHSDTGSHRDLGVPQLGADDRDDNSRSSCEDQTCNASDFYIADMIVAGLPIESNLVYDDMTETTSFFDYRCDEPNMLFDMTEEYMVLPFLEDTMETSNGHDDRTCEEAIIDSYDSSLYLAIHQMRSCNQESDVNPYPDLDQAECFDPHMFIRNLPDLPDEATNFRPTILPKETLKTKRITLVLDLDETLVHSTLEHCEDSDFTFPVSFNMKENIVYVKQRPDLRTFLERVAGMFEIVVFTASQSIYAEQLLDILDPNQKLISRRAYRESCILSDGNYTKDLTVLGVDLAKVVIIDNTPQVFRLQVNNGIPIKSWFDDPSDSALITLLPFLETLVDADDVRPLIAERFGNKE